MKMTIYRIKFIENFFVNLFKDIKNHNCLPNNVECFENSIAHHSHKKFSGGKPALV